MSQILLVTNDFPPRAGGIQNYLEEIVRRLAQQSQHNLIVYAPQWKKSDEFDLRAHQHGYQIIRHPSSLMLPEPGVAARMRHLIQEHNIDTVWFGAAAPLGLLGQQARQAGAQKIIASTHGHETGWAMIPGARSLLGRIGDHADIITYVSQYTRTKIAHAFGAHPRLCYIPPGVDLQRFHPISTHTSSIRQQLNLDQHPTIVCISRLVPRKGQDQLIKALPEICHRVPLVKLLIVGGGPYRPHLEKLVQRTHMHNHVIFAGNVDWQQLPHYYAAGDVFAMPCRSRAQGLDVEGLGIVFLEASASGLPIIVGNSGGAPETVIDKTTGLLVDPHSSHEIAQAVIKLLTDPTQRQEYGKAGRQYVVDKWDWEKITHQFSQLL